MDKKMYELIALLCLIFFTVTGFHPYYKMDVSLNVKDYTIDAKSEIKVTNDTQSKSDSILFTIYPNAFKKGSLLWKDILSIRGNDNVFSKRGGYLDIDSVFINGDKVEYNVDYDLLSLYRTMNIGETLDIVIYWREKIPQFIGREGHIKDGWFEITQWYPKLCVFEDGIWKVVHLREIGEFYGNYSTFDVSITIPSNYMVEGTGDILEREGEIYNQIDEGNVSLLDSIRKSEGTKTVRFYRENIHDFAFVCGKNIFIKDTIRDDGIRVRLFLPEKDYKSWKNALKWACEAIDYYGKRSGKYIYDKFVVSVGNSGAGGMEYPGFIIVSGSKMKGTFIDKFIRFKELVVVHETGHQWFYGMMGNNEMEEPYLDEGFNSYFEVSYMNDKYKRGGLVLLGPVKINDDDMALFAYMMGYHKTFKDFKCTESAEIFNDPYISASYSPVIYSKNALMLRYFEGIVGRDKMDEFFKAYYDKFLLSHPHSQEVYKLFKDIFGYDMGNYLISLLNDTIPIDVSIEGIEKNGGNSVVIINNQWDLPVYGKLTVYTLDSVYTVEYKSLPGVTKYYIDGDVKRVSFYPYNNMPELDKINNQYPRITKFTGFAFPYLYSQTLGFMPLVYPYLEDGIQWILGGIMGINYMFPSVIGGFSFYITPYYKTSTDKIYLSSSMSYSPIKSPYIMYIMNTSLTDGYLSHSIEYERRCPAGYKGIIKGGVYTYYGVKDTVHYDNITNVYVETGIKYFKKNSFDINLRIGRNTKGWYSSLKGEGSMESKHYYGKLKWILSTDNIPLQEYMNILDTHSFDTEYNPDTSDFTLYGSFSYPMFPTIAFYDKYYSLQNGIFATMTYKWKFIGLSVYGGYDASYIGDYFVETGVSLMFSWKMFIYVPIYSHTPYGDYTIDKDNYKVMLFLAL